MKASLLTMLVAALICTSCERMVGPVLVNLVGESLHVKAIHQDSRSYEFELAPKAALWAGRWKQKGLVIIRVNLTGSSFRREIDLSGLLENVPDTNQAAIIVTKSSVEVTTQKEARARGILD